MRVPPIAFLVLATALGCTPEEEFRQNSGVLTVTPTGPIELSSELAGDGTDEPTEVTVTLLNEGPGTVEVVTTRLVYLDGEQDWSLIQGFEAPLRRSEEAELIVSYGPDFESDAQAALTIVIEGTFANEEWDEDQAEILLQGTATD